MVFGNDKCADQPAHAHGLISAFAIHSLENMMTKHATRILASI